MEAETKEILIEMRNLYENNINRDLKRLTDLELTDLNKKVASIARRYLAKEKTVKIPEPYNLILYDNYSLLEVLSVERNRRLLAELTIMRSWRKKSY